MLKVNAEKLNAQKLNAQKLKAQRLKLKVEAKAESRCSKLKAKSDYLKLKAAC